MAFFESIKNYRRVITGKKVTSGYLAIFVVTKQEICPFPLHGILHSESVATLGDLAASYNS